MSQIEILDPVLSALRQALGDDLRAVVLFGSRARGEAADSSDWDLLVIAESLPTNLFRRHVAWKRLLPPEWRGRISAVLRTPSEFEADVTSLALDIALDGIILFDPVGYAGNRFDRLRRLMASKGLRRERTGRDFSWKWTSPPGRSWRLEWEEAP